MQAALSQPGLASSWPGTPERGAAPRPLTPKTGRCDMALSLSPQTQGSHRYSLISLHLFLTQWDSGEQDPLSHHCAPQTR